MDPVAAAGRREVERWMSVAEKLMIARDLEGCKQFASQALSADPRAPGADDLLAAADALLAAERRRLPNGHPDPYAVLGLDPSDPASRHPDAIRAHYRHLSFLLNRSHPDRPCSLVIADAARLVADSWAFLSDPLLKSALDSELDAAAAAARTFSHPSFVQEQPQPPPPPQPSPPPPPPQPRPPAPMAPIESADPVEGGAQTPTFWTVCPSCCHVHQYDRVYEARTLLCPSCRQPFLSEEMAAPPPIVPGTDMYYCTWGFFPIGFPGCPGFERLINSQPGEQCQPNAPWLRSCGGVEGNLGVGAGSAAPVGAAVEAAKAAPVKPMKVKVGAKKRGRPKGSKNKKNL